MEQKLLWHYYCIFKSSSRYFEEYEHKVPWSEKPLVRSRLTSQGWDLVHSSAHEATHLYEVELTPAQLSHVFLNGMQNPYKKWRAFRWKCPHRQGSTHYVRRPHHREKVVEEHRQAKDNWRKEKGINRDKKKCGYKRGAGKYFKRLSNNMHRSWEKRQLCREDYESMSDIDYKLFLDPWMWD